MKFLPPWFRIHLSTAVVLMLAASMLLEMNMTSYRYSGYDSYGWPKECVWNDDERDGLMFNYATLVIDALTVLIVLTALAIILEKRIAILNRIKSEK